MAVLEAKHNRGEKLNAESLLAALGNRPAPHRLFIDPTLPFEGVCFRVQTEAGLGVLPRDRFENRVDHRHSGPWPSSKLGHQGKLESQSLGFDYLAPIDETMLQLNPIING
jgi:hypothetical protein